MDGYLRRVEGLDAQIWIPPSRGQLFWARHAPALFGAADGGTLARWWKIATVAPSTNVTVLNLPYQAYLNMIFHRTRLARLGHAVCMPVIVTGLLALCCPVRLGPADSPVNGSLPAAALLAVWWLAWAVKERDPWWGTACLGLVAVLYLAANAAYGLDRHPLVWVLVGSLLQAASHAREPLPPRVTRSPYWLSVGEYLRGAPFRRAGQLGAQLAFGTVDELVASPRLLPVLLLHALWLGGHAPDRRAVWTALAQKAIASGNPALDYIGIGGSTPLR